MAVYRGKIDIVNMSNITATAGVGIQSSRILYAISNSGVVPPDLVDVDLKTNEGDILTFASTGSSFRIAENILWAWQGNEEVPLSTNPDNVLIGIQEWQPEVPEVGAGQYLWTKTIYYYTNNTQTVTYGVFRQGEDGKMGPEGPAGTTASSFKLECNQSEILKFADTFGNISISPENLKITVLKLDARLESGQLQIIDLNIDNLNIEVYSIDNNSWNSIQNNDYVTIDDLYNFDINLKKIVEDNLSDGAEQLLFNECILKIEYIYFEEEKRYNLTQFLNVRFGMNKDMASLSVKANGIVASMQDSKLKFNAEGLIIQNGSFVIEDLEGQQLLYSENGNLSLKGNIYAENGYFKGELIGATGTFSGALQAATGTFSGELQAATGSFAGNISAASGSIGGFSIESSQLISHSIGENGQPNIILNGEQGIIEAENIILGTGARIKDYIKIGDQVEIRRTKESSESFIRVFQENKEILSLKANGTMNLGNGNNSIILSGSEGSIMSQNYQTGLGWKISNNESIFNDVTIRGSIRASVLEYGETQAIGGAIILRPSSRIVSIKQNESTSSLFLESTNGFEIGDYCKVDSNLVHSFYCILNVNEEYIEVTPQINGVESYPIVNFGKTGSVGIGINGSTDGSLIIPQSISVFDFWENDKKITPHIVLGKLPDEPTYGFAAGTYGLYAENVLLKGSLVTQTDTSNSVTYSGISTLYSGINAPTSNQYSKWFGENTGEILLWAGALGTSKEEVENSKFFVDRNGNLYAGSGYFKGTIITDATISASEIKTAKLTGSNEDPLEPALTISDATRGIVFTATENNEIVNVFEVNKDSIIANVPNFIFNSNFTVGGNGSLIVPNLYVIGENQEQVDLNENLIEALIFDKNKLSYTDNFSKTEMNGVEKGYIDFTSGLVFSPDGKERILELSNQQVKMNSSLYLTGSIKYNQIMEYKPVYLEKEKNGEQIEYLIGYDLYIEEEEE